MGKFDDYVRGIVLGTVLGGMGLIGILGAKNYFNTPAHAENPRTRNIIVGPAQTEYFHQKESYAEPARDVEPIQNSAPIARAAPKKVQRVERNYLENIAQNYSPRKGVIVLDPGHGNKNKSQDYDSGATARGDDGWRVCEADVVLRQAKIVKVMLEDKGYEVYLTREDASVPTPLHSRAKKANKLKADLMVSFHLNGFKNPDANGAETFYCNENSKELAEIIQEGLCYNLQGREMVNRGVKTAGFEVIKNAKMPCVLVESGFVTNSKDRSYLDDCIPDVEQSIANSIDKYMQGVRK